MSLEMPELQPCPFCKCAMFFDLQGEGPDYEIGDIGYETVQIYGDHEKDIFDCPFNFTEQLGILVDLHNFSHLQQVADMWNRRATNQASADIGENGLPIGVEISDIHDLNDYENMTKEELIKCCKAHDAHHEEHHERERKLVADERNYRAVNHSDNLPTFREIQMWAWRRDNRPERTTHSTVSEAAKRFKVPEQTIVDIVGFDNQYFYIVGKDGPVESMYFEHDGE